MKYYFGEKEKSDKNKNDCDSNSDNTKSHNSVINFYSSINDSSINNLINLIDEKSFDAQDVQTKYKLAEAPPIHLHIQSYGGYIFSGLAGMESIRNCGVPVYTYVDGIAASAATFLSCVGVKRYMNREACILIHQLSSVMWGKYEEFKDEMLNLDLLMNKIKRIYKQNTKLTDDVLDNILKRDIYLELDDCIKYGLVDEVTKNY